MEKDELDRKMMKIKEILLMMKNKPKTYLVEVKWLLEIKGNKNNSKSIYDRLNIPKSTDFDKLLENEPGSDSSIDDKDIFEPEPDPEVTIRSMDDQRPKPKEINIVPTEDPDTWGFD